MRFWIKAVAVVSIASVLFSPAAAVSFESERELGRRFAMAARTRLPFVRDAAVQGYVERIGNRIVKALDGPVFEYHFAVVREGSINAFAVPGGYIYVHSGLLTRAAHEDELAAVLSHEIAHVHAHHLARQQEATQLMNYATLLGVLLSVVQPAIGAVATGASAAVQLKYRREFEQEADYMGARLAAKAGYDARSMLDFFKKLADEQRIAPTFMPPYLLSHPLTEQRMNHLEAVLRTQQWADHERPEASLEHRYVQALTRAQSEPPADVVAQYRRAVEQRPDDAIARYLFGVVCLETGQLEAARAALEAARAAGLERADRELGLLALRSRQLEGARSLLEGAVARDPGDSGLRLDLARTLEALGEPQAAIREYREALRLTPDLEAAHYGLGILAGRAGDEAEGLYHVASAQLLRGDYEQALSQYTRARGLMPPGDPRFEEIGVRIRELSDFLRVQAPAATRRD